MTRKATKHGRRSRHLNTMALAKHYAGKLTDKEVAKIKLDLDRHFAALREGKATRHNFAGISTACELALAIESKGVVRGLLHELEDAEEVLYGVKRRADLVSGWVSPVLNWQELDVLAALVRLHLWQVAQLSYGEYQAAWRLMVDRVKSAGGEVIKEGATL